MLRKKDKAFPDLSEIIFAKGNSGSRNRISVRGEKDDFVKASTSLPLNFPTSNTLKQIST